MLIIQFADLHLSRAVDAAIVEQKFTTFVDAVRNIARANEGRSPHERVLPVVI